MSSPISVMVVDDEIELANLFRNFLQRSGFNTNSFTDPLLALEHYMNNASLYSIVITDLRMPKLDGIRLANKIREIDKRVRILLVTAFCTEDIQKTDEFKQTRFADIIQKPLKMSQLGPTIKAMLSR